MNVKKVEYLRNSISLTGSLLLFISIIKMLLLLIKVSSFSFIKYKYSFTALLSSEFYYLRLKSETFGNEESF